MKLNVSLRRPGHSIRRLHQISQALFLKCTHKHGLTPVQYTTLNAIVESEEVDQATLSKLIALDATALVKVLDRLVAKELIARMPDANDKRRRLLVASAKGKILVQKVDPLVTESQKILMRPLTSAEQKQFLALLHRLIEKNNAHSRVPHDAGSLDLG